MRVSLERRGKGDSRLQLAEGGEIGDELLRLGSDGVPHGVQLSSHHCVKRPEQCVLHRQILHIQLRPISS